MTINSKTAKCGGCGAIIPVKFVNVPKRLTDSDGKRLAPEDWTRVDECPTCGVREQKISKRDADG